MSIVCAIDKYCILVYNTIMSFEKPKQENATFIDLEAEMSSILGGHYTEHLPEGSVDVTEVLGNVRLIGPDLGLPDELRKLIEDRDEYLGEGRWIFFEQHPAGRDAETGEYISVRTAVVESPEYGKVAVTVPAYELSTALLPQDVSGVTRSRGKSF